MEIIEEADVTVAADSDGEPLSLKTKTEEILSEEKISEIESILESWREKGLFKDSELTLTILSNRIGIGRKVLTAFFSQSCHCTFRIWLSNIRFEEAKRLFKLHPEYSNDAVSQECGFSSRGQLYNIFRDKTGMSPGEWRDLNVNKAPDNV